MNEMFNLLLLFCEQYLYRILNGSFSELLNNQFATHSLFYANKIVSNTVIQTLEIQTVHLASDGFSQFKYFLSCFLF